jgi:hypothetical protein
MTKETKGSERKRYRRELKRVYAIKTNSKKQENNLEANVNYRQRRPTVPRHLPIASDGIKKQD